jgi:hypothetical protein
MLSRYGPSLYLRVREPAREVVLLPVARSEVHAPARDVVLLPDLASQLQEEDATISLGSSTQT